jgi:hypothetical protein
MSKDTPKYVRDALTDRYNYSRFAISPGAVATKDGYLKPTETKKGG